MEGWNSSDKDTNQARPWATGSLNCTPSVCVCFRSAQLEIVSNLEDQINIVRLILNFIFRIYLFYIINIDNFSQI
jgi:hypothetical protein